MARSSFIHDKKHHTVDALFVITLFLVFAVSLLMLTGTGANVYKNIVSNMDRNYDTRTAFSYISEKLHQADVKGNVSVGTYGGMDAVILSEEIDNVPYCTYLYLFDGSLMELFIRKEQYIEPKYGTKIMDLDGFEIKPVSDDLYNFKLDCSDKEEISLFVHLRSNGGAK